MKRSRRSEAQIAFGLKRAETGAPVAEVIGRMEISVQTVQRLQDGVHQARALAFATRAACSSLERLGP